MLDFLNKIQTHKVLAFSIFNARFFKQDPDTSIVKKNAIYLGKKCKTSRMSFHQPGSRYFGIRSTPVFPQ